MDALPFRAGGDIRTDPRSPPPPRKLADRSAPGKSLQGGCFTTRRLLTPWEVAIKPRTRPRPGRFKTPLVLGCLPRRGLRAAAAVGRARRCSGRVIGPLIAGRRARSPPYASCRCPLWHESRSRKARTSCAPHDSSTCWAKEGDVAAFIAEPMRARCRTSRPPGFLAQGAPKPCDRHGTPFSFSTRSHAGLGKNPARCSPRSTMASCRTSWCSVRPSAAAILPIAGTVIARPEA